MDRKPEGAKDFARANFGKAWQDRINTLYSKAYEMWRVCLHNNRSGNSAVLVQDDNGSWHVFLSEENMQWPIKFADIPGASIKYIRDIRTEAQGQMDMYYQRKHGRLPPPPSQQQSQHVDVGDDDHQGQVNNTVSVILPTDESESLWNISDGEGNDDNHNEQSSCLTSPPTLDAGDPSMFTPGYPDPNPSLYAPVAPMFESLQSGAESAWTLASNADVGAGQKTQSTPFAQPVQSQNMSPRLEHRPSTPRQQSPPISSGIQSPSPSYRVTKRTKEPFFRRHSRANRGGRTTVE